jgi:hypothetical protein
MCKTLILTKLLIHHLFFTVDFKTSSVLEDRGRRHDQMCLFPVAAGCLDQDVGRHFIHELGQCRGTKTVVIDRQSLGLQFFDQVGKGLHREKCQRSLCQLITVAPHMPHVSHLILSLYIAETRKHLVDSNFCLRIEQIVEKQSRWFVNVF